VNWETLCDTVIGAGFVGFCAISSDSKLNLATDTGSHIDNAAAFEADGALVAYLTAGFASFTAFFEFLNIGIESLPDPFASLKSDTAFGDGPAAHIVDGTAAVIASTPGAYQLDT